MARIVDFLETLTDPDVERAFEVDPDGVLARTGLSDKQKELILRGDMSELRDAVNKELGREAIVYRIKGKGPSKPSGQ
jgi:Aromatic-ring-opening dioxygenase LigAB, LigA subunit